jgi:hypothetical protein
MMLKDSQLARNDQRKLEKESVLDIIHLRELKVLQSKRHLLLYSLRNHPVLKALPTEARLKEFLQVNMMVAKTS